MLPRRHFQTEAEAVAGGLNGQCGVEFSTLGVVGSPVKNTGPKAETPKAFGVEDRARSWVLAAKEAAAPSSRFHALHKIFEAQADARPEAVAVVFGSEETTY